MSDCITEKYLCRRLINPLTSCLGGELTLFVLQPGLRCLLDLVAFFALFQDFISRVLFYAWESPSFLFRKACKHRLDFAQPIDFSGSTYRVKYVLKFFAVWGHSARHFPELSPTFAMLSVTPVLGLEELTIRRVLWAAGRCEQPL